MARSAAAASALGAALSFIPATAAQADELEVSYDGSTWADNLHDPLFDPDRRWVPGDHGQQSFWVRNAAETAGDLSLTVDVLPGDELVRPDVLLIRARTDQGSWVDIDRVGQPQSLQTELGPGERQQVVVAASYRAEAGNETQRDRTRLMFTATLTDDSADVDPTAPPTDRPTDQPPAEPPPDSDLPETGAPPGYWLLPVGAAAIGVGAALMRRGSVAANGGRHD